MQIKKYSNNLHNKINLIDIYQNKGITYNYNLQKMSYGKGYQVSIKDLYIIHIKHKNKILKAIKKAYKNNIHGYNIGLWIDENNLCYIDYSINIRNKKQAIKQAKKLKQKSILNWYNNLCIEL